MIPSIKTMIKFGFAEEKAKLIRKYMERDISLVAMGRINDLIDGYGVEYIPEGKGEKSPAIEYVNMGDTYDITVMLINGKYRIGSWGDIVEKGNYQ